MRHPTTLAPRGVRYSDAVRIRRFLRTSVSDSAEYRPKSEALKKRPDACLRSVSIWSADERDTGTMQPADSRSESFNRHAFRQHSFISAPVATHKHPAVKAWFAARPRYQLHFTPTSSSWLNQVERWFAEITRKRIRRGTFRSVRELVRAIEQYIRENNKNPCPFEWVATANPIVQKVKKLQEQ